MKKILSLILALAMVATMLVVPAYAAEVPTAKVVASLVGDGADENGVFHVAFSVEEISSGLFASGQANFSYPADVASLIDYWTYADYSEVALEDGTGLCVGNIYNEYAGRTGKYSTKTNFPETGKAEIAMFIANSSKDQAADELTEVTMFEVAFVLNEGKTMDDFYIELTDGIVFATEGKDVPSQYIDGNVTLVSNIEKKVEVIYESAEHQPGVDKGINTVASGVYELPETLVSGRTYEVSFKLYTHGIAGDTLIGLNNADMMTGSSYFGNSTIMMKVDGDTVKFRNGGDTQTVGTLSSNETTVDVKVVVDLINNKWDATFTENGTVAVERAGMAFRNANLPINALVLCDNNRNPGCLTATDLVVVDTTPASVGEVTFKYVAADGTVLEEVKMSGETGATVAVPAKTLTVDDVKYEAPAAEGVVGTDDVVEVKCVKVETVTISYTVNGEEIATQTVEGVAGAEVSYKLDNFATTTAIYTAEGTIVVDPENLTVPVEATVLYEGIVATRKQTTDAIRPLDKAITGKAKVSYDVVLINPGDGLVAFNSKEAMTLEGEVNYFADSSAYLGIKADHIIYRVGTGNVKLGDITVPGTYHVEATIDVEAKTWTVTVTDAEGAVVGTVENIAFRNANVESLDSIVVLDNSDSPAGTLVVQNLVVEPAETEETGKVTFKYVFEGTELNSVDVEGVVGATVSVEATTITVDGVEYEAPAAEGVVGTDAEVTVECTKKPVTPETGKVTFKYVFEGVEIKSVEVEGVVGETVSVEATTIIVEDIVGVAYEAPAAEGVVGTDTEVTVECTAKPVVPDEPALPYEAKDINISKSAAGLTVTGKFEADPGFEVTDVLLVITYLKDGKPWQVYATPASAHNGVIEIASDLTLTDGDNYEVTIAGISLLGGVTALDAVINGELGIPVGSWK